jgi:hypothetical protein
MQYISVLILLIYRREGKEFYQVYTKIHQNKMAAKIIRQPLKTSLYFLEHR